MRVFLIPYSNIVSNGGSRLLPKQRNTRQVDNLKVLAEETGREHDYQVIDGLAPELILSETEEMWLFTLMI